MSARLDREWFSVIAFPMFIPPEFRDYGADAGIVDLAGESVDDAPVIESCQHSLKKS
jgi:hypothetical protein